jgi:hypothetical protein
MGQDNSLAKTIMTSLASFIGWMRLMSIVLLSGWATCASALAAGPREWVTVYEVTADGAHVRLERLRERSPAIEGALAMLSFLVTPFGCAGPRGDMDCPITRELGLGRQCSEAHIAFVRKWFPEKVPIIGGYHAQRYAGFGGLGPEASMCAQTPEGASVQNHLSLVRMRQTGRRLIVESHVSWYARERSGEIVYRTTFRLEDDAIAQLSNKVIHQTSAD